MFNIWGIVHEVRIKKFSPVKYSQHNLTANLQPKRKKFDLKQTYNLRSQLVISSL